MTHVSNSVTASIYKLTQDVGTHTLHFFVYGNEWKEEPCDRHLTNDELFDRMIQYGREYQDKQHSEGEN